METEHLVRIIEQNAELSAKEVIACLAELPDKRRRKICNLIALSTVVNRYEKEARQKRQKEKRTAQIIPFKAQDFV